MAWLNGRVERQLVTALLLLALLVSCGVSALARQSDAPETTATIEDPTAVAAEPSADDPATAATDPSAEPSEPPVTGAASGKPAAPPTGTATARIVPTAPPTPTRAPSTSPLASHRLVTYYGHPFSAQMGILGEYEDPEEMMAKLKEQTAAYTAADPSRPAQCTIELIASVAQGDPGADGLWLLRTPPDVIERYAQLAEKNSCLLMLDIQMGYDTVANDIKAIMPFLQRPYIHLAIDPEFHVDEGEVPGEHYGHISAADVNNAGKVLGDLVRQYKLPDKILIVHQFRDAMLPDKENIKLMPNVDLVTMMDGWGSMPAKITNYNYFVGEQLIQYGGIKVFYRQDDPIMTPEQVLELEPKPLVVCYQ
jgi:hypothetical protein